ncbi:hypothetical protein GCM10009850_079580 [Nonomuraea monospora]|uniref:Uncharacterized protein n=1 Tax=Nonomuraea monospora TaxID=568818 RepID=A0ABP5PN05_9ACTN
MKASKGGRHRRRVVETEEYVAMLHRMVDALARRLSDDPVGLVHVEPLREHLRDAMNIAIALNQEKPRGYSFGELAEILGMRRESVYERAVRGRTLLADMRARLGVTSLRRHRETRLQEAALRTAARQEDRSDPPALACPGASRRPFGRESNWQALRRLDQSSLPQFRSDGSTPSGSPAADRKRRSGSSVA